MNDLNGYSNYIDSKLSKKSNHVKGKKYTDKNLDSLFKNGGL